MAQSMDWRTKRQVFDGFRLPGGFTEENFRSGVAYKPQKDDLIVASFPKCGTTWMQYIVCLIYSGGVPPKGPIMYGATPFLELIGGDGTDEYERPIPIKTHLPFELIVHSPEAKYIYVARSPRDTIVSYFHHVKKAEANCEEYVKMTFDEFFELFINGTTDWNDACDHILSWYTQRHRDNVLFVTYEEMKKDSRVVIQRVANFLGDQWSEKLEKTPGLLDKIVTESDVKAMKVNINGSMAIFSNPAAMDRLFPPKMRRLQETMSAGNFEDSLSDWQFVRKGVVGDWVNHLSEDQNRRLTEKTKFKLANCPDLLELWGVQ